MSDSVERHRLIDGCGAGFMSGYSSALVNWVCSWISLKTISIWPSYFPPRSFVLCPLPKIMSLPFCGSQTLTIFLTRCSTSCIRVFDTWEIHSMSHTPGVVLAFALTDSVIIAFIMSFGCTVHAEKWSTNGCLILSHWPAPHALKYNVESCWQSLLCFPQTFFRNTHSWLLPRESYYTLT